MNKKQAMLYDAIEFFKFEANHKKAVNGIREGLTFEKAFDKIPHDNQEMLTLLSDIYYAAHDLFWHDMGVFKDNNMDVPNEEDVAGGAINVVISSKRKEMED